MQSMLKYKKIIIIAIIIFASFFVYNSYFKSSSSSLIEVENRARGKLDAGREILALLVDLKSIKLDGSIFDQKSFKTLEDFSLPIDPEPKGRVNPFAPIGVDFEPAEEDSE